MGDSMFYFILAGVIAIFLSLKRLNDFMEENPEVSPENASEIIPIDLQNFITAFFSIGVFLVFIGIITMF